MTGYAVRKEYRSLLVSPVSMRHGLISHIQKEVELHKKQGGGEIILKCNQLVDKKIIKELYRASMAGVRVRLIIRGICCLRPGVPGISDNITVTSIVGRFLEHARVYWFRNGGDGIMYIGSADIMPRNLDRRIEVLTRSAMARYAGISGNTSLTVSSGTICRAGICVRTAPTSACI